MRWFAVLFFFPSSPTEKRVGGVTDSVESVPSEKQPCSCRLNSEASQLDAVDPPKSSLAEASISPRNFLPRFIISTRAESGILRRSNRRRSTSWSSGQRSLNLIKLKINSRASYWTSSLLRSSNTGCVASLTENSSICHSLIVSNFASVSSQDGRGGTRHSLRHEFEFLFVELHIQMHGPTSHVQISLLYNAECGAIPARRFV